MRLPADALIAPEKLGAYLLSAREVNDKSAFLAQAGFTAANAEALMTAIQGLLRIDAEPAGRTVYGPKFCIRGELTGPNGRRLHVVSIWITEVLTGRTRFVTLYPDREI